MNITPSLVIDGIMTVVLLAARVKGYQEGFFTSAIHLAGNIGSILGGLWVSSNYSRIVFTKYLRRPLVQRSHSYLTQAARGVDVNTAISGVMGYIPPEIIQKILSKLSVDFSRIMTPTEESAVMLVDNFLGPVVISMVSVVLFLAAFLVIRIGCNMLAWLFKAINNVPVLGGLNRIAGFGTGALTGCINIILLSLLLSIIVMVTGGGLSFLNPRVLSGSRVMAITSLVNPFI